MLVACVVLLIPWLLEQWGVPMAAWARPFLALGAGGILAWAISARIAGGYRPVLELSERILDGDLREGLPVTVGRFPDESSELARNMAGAVQRLREVMAGIQRNAEQVDHGVDTLRGAVSGVHTSAEDTTSTLSEISKGATQQQVLIGDVTRLINDIASAIEVNASRAREAFGFAAEANQKANAGVDVSRLAIEKMRSVFERVEQAGGNVFQLEAKTRHVHQITEMITSVASRTNLLSLNASIEAARAGEAGRGFAVVADEIRKLAESAARSADEISKLVGEIEADTQSVADEMRESGQMISEGREDVNTIAASLEQIRSAVGEAAGRAEEIFQEADDQARDAETMVQSMDEVAKVSLVNASAVEEVAELARQQQEAVAEMTGASGSLAELSGDLAEMVGRFETGTATEEG
ncbi:MAG: hypothetical protein GY937_11040 [bacterium]|nr:hypothetical protein [bacterium]